jgi:cytochrome oxidase Cu insertion factor (SCO1/SenC/PrrC family)
MSWRNTTRVAPTRTDLPAAARRLGCRRWLGLTGAAAVAVVAIGTAFALAGRSAQALLAGEAVDRTVPALPLENEHGAQTSLAAFRGRVVVLAPFLTLCHEVCPLTTGAFQAMQRDVDRAGLAGKVVFAEASVDPWRDSPPRLRAFAGMTRTHFPLLTGTASQLARFWRFFGVAYWRTREGTPPDTDWLTGKPLRFDVNHTDGLFLIDAQGHERIIDVGMPDTGAHLPLALSKLLNAEGRGDLTHPQAGWTVQEALDDLGRLLGQRIPPA